MMTATRGGGAVVSLPSDTEILVTREFAAPKHLVYKAWTTPELVKRWWNAKRGEVTLAEIDLRVGGTWRYVMIAHRGFEVAFHGVFREIVPNERIVSTEVYEGVPTGMPNEGTLNTMSLRQSGDRTVLTLHVQAPTKQVRDMIIKSGMEAGLQDALELLEQVALSLG